MYFIVETEEQFQQFSGYDVQECFVQPILLSDNVHPILSEISAWYIKPRKSKRGFILPINHSETFSLNNEDVLKLLSKTEQIYTYDKKYTRYYLGEEFNITCLKTLHWLETGEVLDHTQWNTPAHNFMYAKYSNKTDVNRLIPVSKHQEKWTTFVKDNKKVFKSLVQNRTYFRFYNNTVVNSLLNVESAGLPVDIELLSKYYPETQTEFISNGKRAYGWYNFHTSTGRPSNNFAGINFSAMNKSDNSREFIRVNKRVLIEFDYHSYHPNMLARLVGYEFPGEDIHTHLGRMYFDLEELTPEQYSQSKNITFKLLYTNSEEYRDLPFFKAVREYKEKLWQVYRDKGYIPSVIVKRPIRGIESKTQILPYLLQSFETELNVVLINTLQQYLKDKYTKLVMYSYDAFLFDHSKKDGPEVLEEIKSILECEGYTTSTKFGKSYASLKQLLA